MGSFAMRRVRVFLASLFALVLAVSVLVVSPAGAANTASEARVDHDEDMATPEVRQFAGANRYVTSLAIANAYVDKANSTGGFVDTLILASGDSLIDAAAAAGLSAARSAPVVLTTSNRLSRAIENFIVDEFIAEVIIIGGTDSVSQAVEDDLGDIDTVGSITRVAGDDRYSTSALLAEEITTVGEYCDTAQVGAVVVNVDSSFADVIAAGPLAYALELPILLTGADSLSEDVASYLTSAEIEHVIVVGGTTAISQAVVDEITEAGVSDITRIAGENRFATAVAVRAAMAECDGVELDAARAALVSAEAAADGVSAAPLLALGLGDDEEVTPVLLVTSEGLPAETESFLSGLPVRAPSGSHVHIELTAIGGEATVPAAVMQAAIDAAVTSEPLTATITADAGATSARIVFSGPVSAAPEATADSTPAERTAWASSARNPAHYSINGNSLLVQDTVEVSGNTVNIGLAGEYEFQAGDVVALAGGKVKGIATDGRRAGAASLTVVAAAPDRLRPRVSIFAPEDGHEIRIQVTDTGLDMDTVLENDHILQRVMLGRNALSANDSPATVKADKTASSYTICLFGGGELDAMDEVTGCTEAPPSGSDLLDVGDLVTVAAETFSDKAKNTSRTTIARVVANNARPVATRVTVTSPVPRDLNGPLPGGTVDARWAWTDNNGTEPAMDASVEAVAAALADDINYLSITAKASGVGGGAAGNTWNVDWFVLPDEENDTNPRATVSVFNNRKIIRIGFDDDATLFTVVTALLENDQVTENFNVASDALAGAVALPADNPDPQNFIAGDDTVPLGADLFTRDAGDDEVGRPEAMRRPLTGGQSSVTLRLVYNDILESFDYSMLIEDNMASEDFPAAGGWTPMEMVRQSLVTEISVTLHSTDLDELPVLGDTLTLADDLARSYKIATPNTSEGVEAQRLRAG